jgi:hypothetical protein
MNLGFSLRSIPLQSVVCRENVMSCYRAIDFIAGVQACVVGCVC